MKSGDLNPLVSKVYSRVKGLVSLPDSIPPLPFRSLRDWADCQDLCHQDGRGNQILFNII